MSTWLKNIKTYLEEKLEADNIYLWQRPITGDSIVIKPSTSPAVRNEMSSQDYGFDVEVVLKQSPQASYEKAMEVRKFLQSRSGQLVPGGVRFLYIKCENASAEPVDITKEENEVFGLTFTARLIDTDIPTQTLGSI